MQYLYKAEVTEVYDGDTITVDIDLGFNMWMCGQKIRLYRINTPEVRGASKTFGINARDFVREKILEKKVILKTYKDKKGKYGRWLATVIIDGEDLNEMLVNKGFSEWVDY